jgi:hypothetical protein
MSRDTTRRERPIHVAEAETLRALLAGFQWHRPLDERRDSTAEPAPEEKRSA